MGFAIIHHESLVQGAQAVYAAIGLGWTALGYAVLRFLKRKK
ncbi:MAG TPA: hypothetical protein VGQ72_05555 [Pyrinomonadaceae bacterium]|jgi:hypothetical protein|nr:hypothetical protein [Pyrinomonadaceae bacterium]